MKKQLPKSAEAARKLKHLQGDIKSNGKLMKVGAWLDELISFGVTPEAKEVIDKAAKNKIIKEYESLKKSDYPFGNNNHPTTIEVNRLGDIVKNEKFPTKIQYRAHKPDGAFHELSKWDYDYLVENMPPKEDLKNFRDSLELYKGNTGRNPFNIPVYIKPGTDNVFVFKNDIEPIWISENKKRAELNKIDSAKTSELEKWKSKPHTRNTTLSIERMNKKDSLKRELDKLHQEMGDLATTVGSIIPQSMSLVYDKTGAHQTRAELQEELIKNYFHDIYENKQEPLTNQQISDAKNMNFNILAKLRSEEKITKEQYDNAFEDVYNWSPRAESILEKSIDQYNKSTPEQKQKHIKHIQSQLSRNEKGELIGFGLDKDMVAAGEEFLKQVMKKDGVIEILENKDQNGKPMWGANVSYNGTSVFVPLGQYDSRKEIDDKASKVLSELKSGTYKSGMTFEEMAGPKNIRAMQKQVESGKSSNRLTQAITDVITLHPDRKYGNLDIAEAKELYDIGLGKFEITDDFEFEVLTARDSVFKSLADMGYLEYVGGDHPNANGDYVLSDLGREFIAATNARINTLKGAESGTDLFPEDIVLAPVEKTYHDIKSCLLSEGDDEQQYIFEGKEITANGEKWSIVGFFKYGCILEHIKKNKLSTKKKNEKLSFDEIIDMFKQNDIIIPGIGGIVELNHCIKILEKCIDIIDLKERVIESIKIDPPAQIISTFGLNIGDEGMWRGGHRRILDFDDLGNVTIDEVVNDSLAGKEIKISAGQLNDEWSKFPKEVSNHNNASESNAFTEAISTLSMLLLDEPENKEWIEAKETLEMLSMPDIEVVNGYNIRHNDFWKHPWQVRSIESGDGEDFDTKQEAINYANNG